MKKLLTLAWLLSAAALSAQNPIIQTKYTADPAPMVYDGTVFLYTTHDEDDADGFKMYDWLLYTSRDLVNWTDHGVVASLKSFAWVERDNGAWANQVIERNGKFYMYCPIHGNGIGVLVADSPYGPFVDPIGKPLVWQREHWNDIDPSPYIDDDGQAYLYWGNPELYCIRLNEDMISWSGEIMKLDTPEHYQEGPWFYKRDGRYYLAFASTCCPEGIGYAMSDAPTGPWTTRGYIMRPTDRTRGNHPGIIDFHGKSYVFGLNYDLMHLETYEHHERRSVSFAEMHYLPDGTIAEVPYWLDNPAVAQLEPLDPYRRVEAETMAWGYGLKTQPLAAGAGICVTDIDDGETLKVCGVDFGKGARKFVAAVAGAKKASRIEIRLDSADGKLVGVLELPAAGDADGYREVHCPVAGATGTHDVVFCFRGGAEARDLFRWDYWYFKR